MAPSWMMLERFVFRRDNHDSFPGVDIAPFTASDTFLGNPFTIALHVAEPPGISRLYLRWPAGPRRDPNKISSSCVLVAAHHDVLLFRLVPDDPVGPRDPSFLLSQHDHFICRASPSESPPLQLRNIPMCAAPVAIVRAKKGKKIITRRLFGDLDPVGILRRGEDEFAMAQLGLTRPRQWDRTEAELCVLRSKVGDSDHSWEVEQHLPVNYREQESDDLWRWTTDTVLAFDSHLCWVNYSVGGVLLCNVFQENPLVTYLRLPIPDRRFDHPAVVDANRSVCVTKTTISGGRAYEQLMFIDIVREDGNCNGPLSNGTGFSVTFHSLRTTESNGMEWDMTFFVTSDELWTRNPLLPHQALMYPLVSMDKPNVVHFLLREHQMRIVDTLSVVTIDMRSKLVISVDSYISEKDISGPHLDMVRRRFSLLESFLPSEIPKCLNLTR
ncbi:hypothetical protein ACQ4PT_063895 [Festuca glaucescens]